MHASASNLHLLPGMRMHPLTDAQIETRPGVTVRHAIVEQERERLGKPNGRRKWIGIWKPWYEVDLAAARNRLLQTLGGHVLAGFDFYREGGFLCAFLAHNLTHSQPYSVTFELVSGIRKSCICYGSDRSIVAWSCSSLVGKALALVSFRYQSTCGRWKALALFD